ncbi:hypothetical protein AAC387_Pa07g0013 [Persea americana]
MVLHSGFSVYHVLQSILCLKRPKEKVYPSLQHVFSSSDEGLCTTRNAWPCFAFLFSRSDLARGPPSINTLAVIESSAIVFWPRYHQQDLPTAFLFLGDAQEADVRQQSRSTREQQSRLDLNETGHLLQLFVQNQPTTMPFFFSVL